jgi:hypothetical protein
MHLVIYQQEIYYDARSYEYKNVNLLQNIFKFCFENKQTNRRTGRSVRTLVQN